MSDNNIKAPKSLTIQSTKDFRENMKKLCEDSFIHANYKHNSDPEANLDKFIDRSIEREYSREERKESHRDTRIENEYYFDTLDEESEEQSYSDSLIESEYSDETNDD